MAGKSELRRIFIAIDLSDEARAVCDAHIERLRRECPSAKIGWERPEKLHITLKFLGPMANEALTGLRTRLDELPPAAGRLRLDGTGVFPNKNRPRILWIGVNDIDSFASRSQTNVERICRSLGYEPDDRRFMPHITIGRVRDPGTVRAAVDEHLEAQIEPVEFEANGLFLYESKLLPTGSVYSMVARFAA